MTEAIAELVLTKDEQILTEITLARSLNNDNWMRLVGIALEVAPARTRAVLRQIHAADRKISHLLGELGRCESLDEK